MFNYTKGGKIQNNLYKLPVYEKDIEKQFDGHRFHRNLDLDPGYTSGPTTNALTFFELQKSSFSVVVRPLPPSPLSGRTTSGGTFFVASLISFSVHANLRSDHSTVDQ